MNRTFNVYNPSFQHIGTVTIIHKNNEENPYTALQKAKKEFPNVRGVMVSPISTYIRGEV